MTRFRHRLDLRLNGCDYGPLENRVDDADDWRRHRKLRRRQMQTNSLHSNLWMEKCLLPQTVELTVVVLPAQLLR